MIDLETKKRRCVVTGGAGFIGSNLVDKLVTDGHSVVVIDNFHTGRRSNLAHHECSSRLSIHNADIADLDVIRPLFDGAEWVFHLAAMADIVPSIRQPLDYHRANVIGTAHVLESARAAGAKRIVYVASSSCYGIPDVYPTPEDAPIRPMYPYALTKWIGEQYVLHWSQTYQMPAISLRFFNVFGPRHRTTGAYGAVFGIFLAQKLAGKPFTVVGDGTQTRDFTYVSDAVEALIMSAESEIESDVFNVGSGGTYSINHLVELLGGETVYIPKRPGEPDCTFADITRITSRLGWKPRVSFEEGVSRLLEQIDLWRDAPIWTKESIAVATADWFKYLGRE